jgi:predicted Zn-ribbon and HTH transcriptional regulator
MYSSSMPLGPGGVDVLGNLASKMEQQLKDTEHVRTAFDADIRLYKNKQINKKEFVHKLVTYTISLSALNFLVIHVILEMRTALEKGTSMKDSTGGTVTEDSSIGGAQFSFGIEGFLGSSSQGRSGDGGDILTSVNERSTHAINNICKSTNSKESYDRIIYGKNQRDNKVYRVVRSVPKQCAGCGTILLRQTNFCNNCGYKQ